MTFYEAECILSCPHCAAGNKRIVHGVYGARHILKHGDSWAESEHVECSAPAIEDFAERMARRVRELGDKGPVSSNSSLE